MSVCRLSTSIMAGTHQKGFGCTCSTEHNTAGFDHVEEIVALCFAYIRLVSAQGGVSEKAFQQYRDLAQLRFNFAGAAQTTMHGAPCDAAIHS